MDLEFFYKILAASDRLNLSGKPLFKADPTQSTIKVLTENAFRQSTTEEIQALFRKQHLVVTQASTAPKCKFDQSTLLRFARINQQISINGA